MTIRLALEDPEEILASQSFLSSFLTGLHIPQSSFPHFLRQKFIVDMSVYEPEMLVFLDETGADRRNTLRKYGYSMRGKPPQKHTLLVRGERASAIANISMKGLLDIDVVKGTVDGDKFYDYTQKHLLPHLMPYNGVTLIVS